MQEKRQESEQGIEKALKKLNKCTTTLGQAHAATVQVRLTA